MLKKTARFVRWGTPNYDICHQDVIKKWLASIQNWNLSGVVDLFGGRLLIFVLCDVNCKDPPRYRFSPLSTFSRTLLNKHGIDDESLYVRQILFNLKKLNGFFLYRVQQRFFSNSFSILQCVSEETPVQPKNSANLSFFCVNLSLKV